MKKFMNTCGSLAVIMIVAGIVMVVVSGAVKGPEALRAIKSYVANGIEQLDSGVRFDVESDLDFQDGVPVLAGESQQSFNAAEVYKLDAEVGACQLNILPSEDKNIYVHTEGVGSYQGYVKDGTLYLKGISATGIGADLSKGDNGINLDVQLSACKLTLFIPADFYFEEVKLSLGAGVVSGSCPWEAGTLEIELAAGEIELSNVEASSLNLEVGAGSLTYEGSIFKEADVVCGMGDVTIKLDDSQLDYNYDVEVAAGDVTIGNESFGGIAGERNINNNASKNLNVECAMGSVEIAFAN